VQYDPQRVLVRRRYHDRFRAEPGQRIRPGAEIVAGQRPYRKTSRSGDLAHPRRAGILHRDGTGAQGGDSPERDAQAVPSAGTDLHGCGCGAHIPGPPQVSSQRYAQLGPAARIGVPERLVGRLGQHPAHRSGPGLPREA